MTNSHSETAATDTNETSFAGVTSLLYSWLAGLCDVCQLLSTDMNNFEAMNNLSASLEDGAAAARSKSSS